MDESDLRRIQIAAWVDNDMIRKGYPGLVGYKAPIATLSSPGCRTHGILYSCSKCGWNSNCSECNSSKVVSGRGWLGLCSLHLHPATPSPIVEKNSPEYAYILQIIRNSLTTGNAFYAQAPFATHGIPISMNCGLKIHEIVRHSHSADRFAATASVMHSLRADRGWDHGLPPIEEYPIFVGCCRDEAGRIAVRGFCPFYTETHDGSEGVIFGSKFFQFAMAQADRGMASLRLIHPTITPARRYVCIARALTGRLECGNKTDRSVSADADTGGDDWVRAYYDSERLKSEYVVVYEYGGDDVDVKWG